MNGIQSLMQGAPTQQPQQPQQAPAMPNDPRMGAAMGLVDDNVEKFNLDPQTEALMLQNQALDLLKAADNVGKMNVPQQDTNIQEQTEQGIAGMLQRLSPGMQQRGQQMQRAQARQMLGGGAPAPARPPMPQQGMARPPMPQQGMAGLPARNMQGMARGGVIGYAGPDGSQVKPTPMPTMGAPAAPPVTPEQVAEFLATYKQLQADAERSFPEEKAAFKQRIIDFVNNSDPRVRDAAIGSGAGMARGGIIGYNTGGRAEQQQQAGAAYAARQAEARENQSIVAAKNNRYVALLSEGVPAEEARAIVEAEALAASGERIPFEMRPNSARDVGNVANIGGIAGLLAKAGQKEPPFRMQGVEEATPTVGTPYDPTGTKSAGLLSGAGQDTFVPAVGAPVTAPVAQQEYTPTALDLLVEKELEAALNANPNTAATTRGDRLRELTGLDDLMARRIESERAVRAQKESRLSPEQTRKRRIQAGLAGLAERGLGGFGAGRTSEMDKIAAERLGIEETSLADLNSLIAEKRAMGMTQFEAENSARAEIQASEDNAAAVAGRLGDAQRAAFATSQENALDRAATADQNRLNRDSNERVAALQVAGSNETDLVRRLNIRMEEIEEANPELSKTEIASRAMNMLEQQETSAALARVGIQASQQDFARYQAAAKIVIDRLATDLRTSTLSAAEQQTAYETALDKEMENIERVLGGTPSTRNPNTPPLTSFDGS